MPLSRFYVVVNQFMISRKTQKNIMRVLAGFMIVATVLFLLGPAVGIF